jgi:RNA polymerase sigma factor (sigma-70 family)
MLRSIINSVFDGKAEYDEMMSNLYMYLMANDAAKLRHFQFRCSVYRWLKIVASRFFIRLRNNGEVIENESREPLYECQDTESLEYNNEKEDFKRLLSAMPNQRYAMVLKLLIVEDMTPEEVAQEMGIKTANLYNIKKRAIEQLTQILLKDIHYYAKY